MKKLLSFVLVLVCCSLGTSNLFGQADDGICVPTSTIDVLVPNDAAQTTVCPDGSNQPTFAALVSSLPDTEFAVEYINAANDTTLTLNADGSFDPATAADGETFCVYGFGYDLAAINGLLVTADGLCPVLDVILAIPVCAPIADLIAGANDGNPGLNNLEEALSFAASFGAPITGVEAAVNTLDGLNAQLGGFGLGNICYAATAPVCYTVDSTDPACGAAIVCTETAGSTITDACEGDDFSIAFGACTVGDLPDFALIYYLGADPTVAATLDPATELIAGNPDVIWFGESTLDPVGDGSNLGAGGCDDSGFANVLGFTNNTCDPIQIPIWIMPIDAVNLLVDPACSSELLTLTVYPALTVVAFSDDAANCGDFVVDLVSADGLTECETQTVACAADGAGVTADFTGGAFDFGQGCSTLSLTSAACAGCAATAPVSLSLADPCDCTTATEIAPGFIIAQETLTITPGTAPYDVTVINNVFDMTGAPLSDIDVEALITAADPGTGAAFDVVFWVDADGIAIFDITIVDAANETDTQVGMVCTPCCPTVDITGDDSACNGDGAITVSINGLTTNPDYNFIVNTDSTAIEFVDNGDGTLTFDPTSLTVASATAYNLGIDLSYSNGTCPVYTDFEIIVDACVGCPTCPAATWEFGFVEPEVCSTEAPVCFDFSSYVGSENLAAEAFSPITWDDDNDVITPNVTTYTEQNDAIDEDGLLAGTSTTISVCFDYDDDPTNGPGSSNLLDLTALDSFNFAIDYDGTTAIAEGDYDTIGVNLTIGGLTITSIPGFTCNDPGPGGINIGPDALCPSNDHFEAIEFEVDAELIQAAIPMNTGCNECPAGDPICVNYFLQSNSLDWQISLTADLSFQYNNLSAGVDAPLVGNLNDDDPALSNLPAEAFTFDMLTGEYCVNSIFYLENDTDTDADGNIDWPGGVTYDLADYDEVQVCFTGGSCKVQANQSGLCGDCDEVCTEEQCQTILFLETVYCDLDQNGGFTCGDADFDLEQLYTSNTTQGGTFTAAYADGSTATLAGNYIDVSSLVYTGGQADLVVTYIRTEGNKCDAGQGAECTTTVTIYEPINVTSWTAPSVVCEDATTIALPMPGDWTGAGVTNDTITGYYSFSPVGLGGELVVLTWEASNGLCEFSESYSVNVESSFDVAIANNPSGAVCLDAIQGLGIVDFNSYLTGTTSGAGYWSYSYNGAADVAFGQYLDLGTNAAVGDWTFTYTIDGDGNCGSSDSFSISVDTGCTEGFDLTDSVICVDSETGVFDLTPYLDFALEGSVSAEAEILTGVCDDVVFPAPPALGGGLPLGTDGTTVCAVAPGAGALSVSIPTVPTYGVINTFDITFSYFGTRPGADGDLDTISLSFGGQEVFAFDNTELNAFFGNADNHFGEITISFVPTFGADGYPISYTAYAGEGTFNSEDIILSAEAFDVCALGNSIEYYLYSNSAYWDAELSVEATWYAQIEEIFGAATLHEVGTELPLGANPCGSYSIATLEDGSPATPVQVLFTSEGCGEYDEVDLNVSINCTCNENYACLATGSATIVFLETYSSEIKNMEACMPVAEFDLTSMFNGADQGGTFTADGGMVMGDIFMPMGQPGVYNITYCINEESACNETAEAGCSTATLTIDDARFTALASACTGVTAGDIVTPNVAGGTWTANGDVIDASTVIAEAGTYTITYSVGSGMCTESADVVIYDTVDPIPAIEDVTVCEGEVVDLNALLPEGVVANWTGFNVIGGEFYSSGLGGFVFQFDGMVGTEECGQSTSVMITVDAEPDANFTLPSVLCVDDAAITLGDYVTTGGSFAVNGEAATEFTPSTDNAGVNTITYSVSAGNCTSSETATITVLGSEPVKFEVVDGDYTRCLDADGAFEMTLDGDAAGVGSWVVNCAIPGATDYTSIDEVDGIYTFNYDISVVEEHNVVPYTITYDMPGSCSNSFTQTVTIYNVPENNNSFDDVEICSGSDIPTIEGIIGGPIDNFYITDGTNVIYESPNVFFDNTLSWTPDTLAEGITTYYLYIENQYGCSSDPTEITFVNNPLPELTWNFGCTDPVANADGNYAAALMFDATAISGDYTITIYDSEGNGTTGGINDDLFVINAGEVYTASVIDGNGCTNMVESIRAEYAVEFATEVDACSEDGFIKITVDVDENTGYGSPYEYSFDGGLSFDANPVATLAVTANPTISILVRDQKGCLSAFDIIEVGTVSEFIPTVSCADENGNVTIDFNYTGDNYTASVSVDGAEVASIFNGTEYTVNVTNADAPDDVTITITSNDGDVSCSATGTVTVYPALITESGDTVCEGEAITFLTEGGTGVYDLTVYPFGGAEGVNIGAVGANQLVADLPAGTHTYTITSGNCTASGTFSINGIAGDVSLVYNSSFDSALTVCGDSDLTVTVTGGTSYVWYDDAGNMIDGETGNSITIPVTSSTGTYTVAAVDNGCQGPAYQITPIYNAALSTTTPVYNCSDDGLTYTVSFYVNGGLGTDSQVLVNGVLTDRSVTLVFANGTAASLTISSNGSSCNPISLDLFYDDCEPEPELTGCAALEGNIETVCDSETGLATIFITILNAGDELSVENLQGATFQSATANADQTGTIVLEYVIEGGSGFSFNAVTDCKSIPVTVSTIDCSNVAIELIDFSGSDRDNGNFLTWTTSTETDNAFFTLERSTDGVNFTAIAKLEGAGTTSTPTAYDVLDVDATDGTSFYRLLATDFNGVTTIAADVIDITRRSAGTIAVSPVPASDYINVVVNMKGDVELSVYDVTGQLVEVVYVNGTDVQVDLAAYAAGTYFLTASNGAELITTKFIVK